VYHWPLFLLLDHTRTGLAPLPLTFVRVGATVALATVSYFVIEQPIRVQRFPRVRWGWVAAPVAAMTAVSAAVIVAANAPPPAIQFQPVESASSVKALAAPPPAHSRPRAPRVGGARGTRHAPPVPVPRRVLVAGDSVALTLGRGVERWGMRNGISVLNGGVLGCTLMYDGLLVRGPLDQIFTRPHDACHTQDGWARTVATYRPDVVVVLLGAWDVYDLSWDGGRTWSGAGQPEFDAHYLAVVRAATLELAAYGAHVLWLNPPCFGRHAGDNSTASSPWYDPARVAALGRMQQEVAHATHEYATEVVHTLGCPVDYTARPDGVHYTDAAADAVMPALGPVIEALLPR